VFGEPSADTAAQIVGEPDAAPEETRGAPKRIRPVAEADEQRQGGGMLMRPGSA
jgi:hypothetical protein